MHHLLAGTHIRLTYLQDRRALRAIDWPGVFDDLVDAGTKLNNWRWCDLDGLTHVVLATDRETGQHAGVLGLTEQKTAPEPWLMIENVLVRPKELDGPLPCAMLAHALARIVCLDGKPSAMASPRASRNSLYDLGWHISAAAMHPPADGNVVALEAARLGRSLGLGHAVLDLRPVSEVSLLRDLRGLHGIRPDRLKSLSALRPPTAKPARSGGATRRPRKATRTDRTG
jgi:hypothetical protein